MPGGAMGDSEPPRDSGMMWDTVAKGPFDWQKMQVLINVCLVSVLLWLVFICLPDLLDVTAFVDEILHFFQRIV
jgi:hypothetical protein